MLEIIKNNPFRTLGVCSNAPLREMVANKNKMSAFLKVDKRPSFPTDLDALLGEFNRTAEAVAEAYSQLSIPTSKLHAAQFWLIRQNALDDMGIKQLGIGQVDRAIETWRKKEDMSSLQDLAICHLIRDDIRNASICLSKLYDSHRQEFLSAIGVNNTDISQLVEGYITEIMSAQPNIDIKTLTNNECSETWNQTAQSKIATPLIRQLTDAVAKAKTSRGQGPMARLQAGKVLNKEAKMPLFKLRKLLGTKDPQTISISDKVSNEILSCSIDYYNDTPGTTGAEEAMKLQKMASQLALGAMTKQRCSENGETLQEVIDSLPPREVASMDERIVIALRKYCNLPDLIVHAVKLIEETRVPLSDMRTALGESHPFYINRSSQIVGNALSNLVAEVNAKQKAFNETPSGSSAEKKARNEYKKAVDEARSLGQVLKTHAMNDETRTRLERNLATLEDLYKQLKESEDGDSGLSTFLGCLLKIIGWVIVVGIAIALRNC